MLLNSLNRDMSTPFRSHRGLLGRYSARVLEGLHWFQRGFLQRDASTRALWSDTQTCSQNVSPSFKCIGHLSDAWDDLLAAVSLPLLAVEILEHLTPCPDFSQRSLLADRAFATELASFAVVTLRHHMIPKILP